MAKKTTAKKAKAPEPDERGEGEDVFAYAARRRGLSNDGANSTRRIQASKDPLDGDLIIQERGPASAD